MVDLVVVILNDCVFDTVQAVEIMSGMFRLFDNGVALVCIVGFGKTICDAESTVVDCWWGDAFVTGVGLEFLEISSIVNLGGMDV